MSAKKRKRTDHPAFSDFEQVFTGWFSTKFFILCFTRNNLTCPTLQFSFAKVLQWLAPWFLTISFSHTEYLFFMIFKSFILFKCFIVTNVDVYEFHALAIRNEEKTMQWSYNVIASNYRNYWHFRGDMNSHVSRLYAIHLSYFVTG